jgi:hypothetical protein
VKDAVSEELPMTYYDSVKARYGGTEDDPNSGWFKKTFQVPGAAFLTKGSIPGAAFQTKGSIPVCVCVLQRRLGTSEKHSTQSRDKLDTI